jgi:hypothetical protein
MAKRTVRVYRARLVESSKGILPLGRGIVYRNGRVSRRKIAASFAYRLQNLCAAVLQALAAICPNLTAIGDRSKRNTSSSPATLFLIWASDIVKLVLKGRSSLILLAGSTMAADFVETLRGGC